MTASQRIPGDTTTGAAEAIRLLFAIPHFYEAAPGATHGSGAASRQRRAQALTSCLAALRALFSGPPYMIDIARHVACPAGQATAAVSRIVVCTSGGAHLLDDLALEAGCYEHHATRAEPSLLGFECQAVLRDALGDYDYFCYLEDDLVLRDPWFFAKVAWVNALLGPGGVVQPNRYEVAARGPVRKVYVDGDLPERVRTPFQHVAERPVARAAVMGRTVEFRRAGNPHSGCFFLDAERMAHWTAQPHFLDRDTSFVGPLESAATLGLMRTFEVYKPAPEMAGFLEIEHFGTAFLRLVRPPAATAP